MSKQIFDIGSRPDGVRMYVGQEGRAGREVVATIPHRKGKSRNWHERNVQMHLAHEAGFKLALIHRACTLAGYRLKANSIASLINKGKRLHEGKSPYGPNDPFKAHIVADEFEARLVKAVAPVIKEQMELFSKELNRLNDENKALAAKLDSIKEAVK